MLIILVGGTLEAGKNSRLYFEKNGYSVVKKYDYYPENDNHYHHDSYTKHTEEEVEQCDFKYNIHGGKTGFYKAQIIDAVRGRCNTLITMSPDNIEFIREIKDTFGEYVVLVYLYIDKNSLETMTRTYVEDEIQVERRLQKGIELRKMYLENQKLFDKTVIFSADSEFNLDALYAQYDVILKEAEKIQKKANERLYVELPYTGNQDYVFVSYSHKDTRRVLPYLSALQREGYRVWYDEGIHKGENWRILLGERLEGCKNFLLFSSENAVASEEVQSEINGLLDCGKVKPITVRLDNAKFPLGIDMVLTKYQLIFEENENVVPEIISTLSLSTKVK